MEAYDTGVNMVLDIKVEQETKDSIDSKLAMLPDKQQAYFRKTFLLMLENTAWMTE